MEIKKAKFRTTLHRIITYKDQTIYIRQIGREYFEYLVMIDGDLHANYIIMKPEKGKKTLTKDQVNQTVAMILSGGVATVDNILKIKEEDKLDKNTKKEKHDD